MKKMTKRKLQAIRTKNNILEIALPMIKEKGFANVTVDDICIAAGIAKGTFYHYFESKEKVFGNTGIMLDDLQLDNLLNNKQISSLDKIYYIVDAYMLFIKNQGIDITRQLFKAFLDGNDIYNEETTGIDILLNTIDEGIERKEFNTNLTTYEIAELILSYSMGLIVY
ncbi:MAG: TetR/AcrR family transcriptional regulator, partial [Syntrophomonadaceae bacterium]|nr:TetR/AcrR family transcriptional regulator [Syntrophomonadaceae bacterium]